MSEPKPQPPFGIASRRHELLSRPTAEELAHRMARASLIRVTAACVGTVLGLIAGAFACVMLGLIQIAEVPTDNGAMYDALAAVVVVASGLGFALLARLGAILLTATKEAGTKP